MLHAHVALAMGRLRNRRADIAAFGTTYELYVRQCPMGIWQCHGEMPYAFLRIFHLAGYGLRAGCCMHMLCINSWMRRPG